MKKSIERKQHTATYVILSILVNHVQTAQFFLKRTRRSSRNIILITT